MLKEKTDSVLAIMSIVAFIILAIYLLTQDASSVWPI